MTVHFLWNREEIDHALEYITQTYATDSIVAVDTETDNSLPQLANLYGYAVSFDGKEAFYIPTRDATGGPVKAVVDTGAARDFMQAIADRYSIIGHNYVYDYIVFKREYNLCTLSALHADTILLKHTVDEERPHGLKETALKYLGSWADKAQTKLYASIEANGGTTTKDNLQMFKADTEVLGEYCGWDVMLTYRLYQMFIPMLKEQGLTDLFFDDEVMPLYKTVTIPMTENGFPVDVQHFENLDKAISEEIGKLEDTIQDLIAPHVEDFCAKLLDENYGVKRSGVFPKLLAKNMGVELPVGPTGKPSMAKTKLAKILDPEHPYTKWLLNEEDSIKEEVLKATQVEYFFLDNPNQNYVFNLKSNDHLGQLLFNILGEECTEKTESGKPKVNEDVLESFASKHEWIRVFLDMKKLNKLHSTYITAILERQQDGVLYPSWNQHGTTSGRYSSANINCQNLPRIKEDDSGLSDLVLSYANRIKEGFITKEGYKLIGADYSQLEPCAFACASGDASLQEVFRNGHDLYSAIAIRTFKLEGYSADKKADNYLGKHLKEYRQRAKVIALAVVYGAGAGRLAGFLGVTVKEAQAIIDAYLEAYPQLRTYMKECDTQAIKQGFVVSRFGRIRHIPKAQALYSAYGDAILDPRLSRKPEYKEVHWEMKGLLNLAKNHPIQSTAAYIVNKAAIAFSKKMQELKLSGRIVAQVHDELTCIAKDEEVDTVKRILQECMETTTLIEVPLRATPVVGSNWAEAK